MGSGYWIHGKTSLIDDINQRAVMKQDQGNEITCLTMENTNIASSPIEIIPKDCTLKRSVMCMLDVPEVPILSTPTIPPKFPCISSNQEVTKKRKRDVERKEYANFHFGGNSRSSLKLSSIHFGGI